MRRAVIAVIVLLSGCSSAPDPATITTIAFDGRNFSQLGSSERLGSKFGVYSTGATVADSDDQLWLSVVGGAPAHAMDKIVEFTTTDREIIAFDRSDVDGCIAVNETRANAHFTMYAVTKPCGYGRSCALLFGRRGQGTLANDEAKSRCIDKAPVLAALNRTLKSL
jgi:hypothetical protein